MEFLDHGDPYVDELWRQRLGQPASIGECRAIVPDINEIFNIGLLEFSGATIEAKIRRRRAGY